MAEGQLTFPAGTTNTQQFNMPMGNPNLKLKINVLKMANWKPKKEKEEKQKKSGKTSEPPKPQLKPEFFKPKGPINAPEVIKPSNEMPRPTIVQKGVQGAKSNPQYHAWKAQVRDYQANTSAQQFARPNVSPARFPEKTRVPGAQGLGRESSPAKAQVKANELAGIRKYNTENGFAGPVKKAAPATANTNKPTTKKPPTSKPATAKPAMPAKTPPAKTSRPKAPGPKRA